MVANFTVAAGWMRFDRLDRYQPGIPAHALAWRLTDTGTDPWTVRLNRFKNGERAAISGAARVLVAAIPALMEGCGWEVRDTAIIAALSSGDTATVPSKPLPVLAQVVANALRIRYLPSILTKKAHRSLHRISAGTDRDAEAAKAEYKCVPVEGVRRILALDDFITRGTTLNNIALAVKQSNGNIEVHPIGLGKTEKKSYAATCGVEIDNEHVPAGWAELWDRV